MDRSALARATEGTDAPTPGYLYVDLARQAGSNPAVGQEMAQYLVNRLRNKQNPNIKYKCCKVIQKLCEQVPRGQFQRCLPPDGVSAIKEAMGFRGPIDIVQGDAKNERVRQAAKEALDAIYNSENSEASAGPGTAYGGRSATYAAAPHAGATYATHNAGTQAPRRMEGIGNPMFADPRNDPRNNMPQSKVQASLKEAGEVVLGMIKDPLARNVGMPNVPRQGHGELPSRYGAPPGQAELARQTNGQWTMASNRGPNAMPPPPNYNQDSDYYRQKQSYQWAQGGGSSNQQPTSVTSGTVGGSWGSAATPSVYVTSNGSGGGGNAVSDGSYEKNLIAELCPPGGMKPVPPPDRLANFGRSVASLNADVVCPILLDCLEDGQPWIIRAKALCVMEVAIQCGGEPYHNFFYACQDEIVPLAQHARAAIKEPASRVLSLLGLSAPVAAAVAPPAETPNLLDFDGATTESLSPPPPIEAPPPPPTSGAGGGSSLFGGMQVKSKAPVVREKAPLSNDNLLDLMSSPSTPSAEAPGTDVFVGEDKGTSSMFASLSVKDTEKAKQDDITDASTASGSAFGFINQGSSKDSDDMKPKLNNFDPLSDTSPKAGELTPTTQHKIMMQMSPEQMQAMAYQQMMMQQQMQMQMMMQQQHGFQQQRMMYPTLQPQQSGGGSHMGLTYMNAKPAKKDDKKFDFVKDAMHGKK